MAYVQLLRQWLNDDGDLIVSWMDSFPFDDPLPFYKFQNCNYKYDHTLPCDLNDFSNSQVNGAGQCLIITTAVYKFYEDCYQGH
jgi:hypothetical protein